MIVVTGPINPPTDFKLTARAGADGKLSATSPSSKPVAEPNTGTDAEVTRIVKEEPGAVRDGGNLDATEMGELEADL